MGLAQFQGGQDVKTVRRYFSGTTQLRKGQVLVYDPDAKKNSAAQTTASEEVDLKKQMGRQVVAVAADGGNIGFPAGIVSATEAGKTGPCYVELLVPQAGDVVDVEVDGTTDIAAKDFLEIDPATSTNKGCLIKSAAQAAGEWLFRSFEAYSTDGKGVVKAIKL